jgi:hypothetical protein
MRATLAAVLLLAAAPLSAVPPAARWWKGNLHTHSLWSDGKEAPEKIARWYKSRGYNFLSLTEHNILKTLAAREGGLEEPGRFLLLPGEEISGRFGRLPVHVNGIGLSEAVVPRSSTGLPMLAILNHPNFGWALSAEDLIGARGAGFFEVYSGHPEVNCEGDASHPGTERLWDLALAFRLETKSAAALYGVGVDDAHDYATEGPGRRNPGRGWIMVRAPELSAAALVAAMEAGDFYASSGVALKKLSREKGVLSLEVEAEEGVAYTTRFIGTRRGFDRGGRSDIGVVLAEVRGPSAAYALKGDELYVRALVVSSKPKANPVVPGEVEKAWVEPMLP